MKKPLFKGLFYILLGYLLLVALHFVYLTLGGEGDVSAREYSTMRSMKLEMPMAQSRSYANIATLSFKAGDGAVAVDQKYEKIGTLSSETEDYESDEQKTRTVVKEHNALIQEEAVNSTDSFRQLQLTLGVPPDSFDIIVAALKTVGKAGDFQVTKNDKTNDFLELKVKRATLEKARDSLVSLKSQGGKIDELVKLEQEILKLEDQIQGLGVQLGQFDKVNEFCTVRFNLTETPKEVVHSPHLGYLIKSLQWASVVYLGLLGCTFIGLLGVLLVMIILQKAKTLNSEA